MKKNIQILLLILLVGFILVSCTNSNDDLESSDKNLTEEKKEEIISDIIEKSWHLRSIKNENGEYNKLLPRLTLEYGLRRFPDSERLFQELFTYSISNWEYYSSAINLYDLYPEASGIVTEWPTEELKEIEVENPNEEIEFENKNFEKFIRIYYNLGDAPIKRKDVAYRKKLIISLATEELMPFATGEKEDLGINFIEAFHDMKYFTNLEEFVVDSTVAPSTSGIWLGHLSNLYNLRRITIIGIPSAGDYSALKNLKNLEYLYIANSTSDIEGNYDALKDLKKLRILHLNTAYGMADDLSFLDNLVNLNSVMFGDNVPALDMSYFNKLKNLKSLRLSNPPRNIVGDLSSIDDISNLKIIEFRDFSNLTKFNNYDNLEFFITEMSSYAEEKCGLLEDNLKAINKFSNLKYLDLGITNGYYEAKKLSLSNLSSLRYLSLSVNDGIDFDFEPLLKYNNLENIQMRNIAIEKIESLAKLTKLKFMNLYGNISGVLHPFSELKELNFVRIINFSDNLTGEIKLSNGEIVKPTNH